MWANNIMIEPEKMRLIEKLRSRKRENINITSELASRVLKSYLIPLLSSKFISKSERNLNGTPRHKPGDENIRISDKLLSELNKAQRTLSELRSELERSKHKKKALLHETQEIKNYYLKSKTVYENQMYHSKINPEVCVLETINLDRIIVLISENYVLKQSVELERSLNNIRLIAIYSLNFFT